VTPESQILAAVLRRLQARGIYCWRNSVGAYQVQGRWIRYGLPGSSDVLGILPDGRFLAVECKAASGRLSPEQTAFLERVRAAGGVAIIARSASDIDDALDGQVALFERKSLKAQTRP
jgi:hypothetical protein